LRRLIGRHVRQPRQVDGEAGVAGGGAAERGRRVADFGRAEEETWTESVFTSSREGMQLNSAELIVAPFSSGDQ
jgi:hypothetical protein